jgi:hypothetical protein
LRVRRVVTVCARPERALNDQDWVGGAFPAMASDPGNSRIGLPGIVRLASVGKKVVNIGGCRRSNHFAVLFRGALARLTTAVLYEDIGSRSGAFPEGSSHRRAERHA